MATQIVNKNATTYAVGSVGGGSAWKRFVIWITNVFSPNIKTSNPISDAEIQRQVNKANAYVHSYQTFR